jgi:hypothetical protein
MSGASSIISCADLSATGTSRRVVRQAGDVVRAESVFRSSTCLEVQADCCCSTNLLIFQTILSFLLNMCMPFHWKAILF